MKYADLHVHTFYSDSTFSPEEAVSCAREHDLSAIAICDHDCIDGIDDGIKSGLRQDIEVIPAVELTAEKLDTLDTEIHLLGYFIDWKNENFQKKLKEVQSLRIDRIYKMIEKLKELNIEVSPDEVFKLAGKGSVGRLHLAQAMLKSGKINNLYEAFEKYIGFSKPCYVPNAGFIPKEAIELLLGIGGVPVLAHPDVMGRDEDIPEYIKYGLRGIEVYHTDHKPNVRRHYEEVARRYNLIMTGGSDCHGLGKGRVLMGGVRVPYEFVETLKEASRIISNERR